MKTNKISTLLITLGLVLFLSSNGISNPAAKSGGNILKNIENKIKLDGKDKTAAPSTADESNFNYLRFDVNQYVTESTIDELPAGVFDYLRFDVNQYSGDNESEITELPSNEFEFLRFDVNNYVLSNPVDPDDMPVNDFDYLRFDVNDFISVGSLHEELPLTE